MYYAPGTIHSNILPLTVAVKNVSGDDDQNRGNYIPSIVFNDFDKVQDIRELQGVTSGAIGAVESKGVVIKHQVVLEEM